MKKLFFIFCVTFMFATNAHSWSSTIVGYWISEMPDGTFATHQFLNEKAYAELRRHPAYDYIDFPTLDDIQRHGSVSAPLKMGLGPDVECHWFIAVIFLVFGQVYDSQLSEYVPKTWDVG